MWRQRVHPECTTLPYNRNHKLLTTKLTKANVRRPWHISFVEEIIITKGRKRFLLPCTKLSKNKQYKKASTKSFMRKVIDIIKAHEFIFTVFHLLPKIDKATEINFFSVIYFAFLICNSFAYDTMYFFKLQF